NRRVNALQVALDTVCRDRGVCHLVICEQAHLDADAVGCDQLLPWNGEDDRPNIEFGDSPGPPRDPVPARTECADVSTVAVSQSALVLEHRHRCRRPVCKRDQTADARHEYYEPRPVHDGSQMTAPR